MPSKLSSASARVPILPNSFPPLVGPPEAASGIFAPASSGAWDRPKHKTSVKAIYRPVTAFRALVAIPIFPHLKTPHRGPQSAPQRIKQPRPAPSWRKPGHFHLFLAMDSTAQRSAVWSYQAHIFPLHFTPPL